MNYAAFNQRGLVTSLVKVPNHVSFNTSKEMICASSAGNFAPQIPNSKAENVSFFFKKDLNLLVFGDVYLFAQLWAKSPPYPTMRAPRIFSSPPSPRPIPAANIFRCHRTPPYPSLFFSSLDSDDVLSLSDVSVVYKSSASASSSSLPS